MYKALKRAGCKQFVCLPATKLLWLTQNYLWAIRKEVQHFSWQFSGTVCRYRTLKSSLPASYIILITTFFCSPLYCSPELCCSCLRKYDQIPEAFFVLFNRINHAWQRTVGVLCMCEAALRPEEKWSLLKITVFFSILYLLNLLRKLVLKPLIQRQHYCKRMSYILLAHWTSSEYDVSWAKCWHPDPRWILTTVVNGIINWMGLHGLNEINAVKVSCKKRLCVTGWNVKSNLMVNWRLNNFNYFYTLILFVRHSNLQKLLLIWNLKSFLTYTKFWHLQLTISYTSLNKKKQKQCRWG